MLGYRLGEYVADCLAGVFSLDDALLVVMKRAQLIQSRPEGMMLAVALSEERTRQYVNDAVSLAAVNGEQTCVLAGPAAAIVAVEGELSSGEVAHLRVEAADAVAS